MAVSLKSLRRSLIGVSPKYATSFSKGDTDTWKQLETAVLSALEGYHAILDSSKFENFLPQLDTVPLELRGYAYEGAAMGLTGLDCMLPWKNRLQTYIEGPGSPHIYMVHIGAGEALARLKRKPEPFIARLPDRVLCWLVMDGYGFHEGFFSRQHYIVEQAVPKYLSPYARRIFDQGLGRSLWFTAGGNGEQIASVIASFTVDRQADMWAGVGVGCAYVGGVDSTAVQELKRLAGPYKTQMAMGAATVAKGRQRAGNPAPHSDLACEILCGVSSATAAQMLDDAFEDVPVDGPEPALDIVQRRVMAELDKHTELIS